MHASPLSLVNSPLPDKIEALHARALRAAESFRQSEAELIDVLIEVDREKLFRKLGFASLFVYVTSDLQSGGLGLSEAVAYNAIAVARKAAQIPKLQESIRTGDIGISKARKILPVLNTENPAVWIEKATTLSSRHLEREVARENPKAATPERAHYVSAKRLNLHLGIDESLMLDLRRAQDIVSRSKGHPVTLEETLQQLVAFFLPRKDPVERAKRVIAKKGSQPVPGQVLHPAGATPVFTAIHPTANPATHPATHHRTAIPAAIAHAVRLRDGGRCQFRLPCDRSKGPDGEERLCGERRWTDLHHIHPVSQGGGHTVENLTTLCRSHHQAIHERLGK
jgi:5-methylcytosine-specific restriction endonuclease McrA